MAGGVQNSEGAASPRAELARLRAGRERQEEEICERIELAMLEACGEHGYRSVSVQDVIDRYGGNRTQFYRYYAGKPACFEAAYERAAARLVDLVLAAGRDAPSWRPGLRAALARLADFVAGQPSLARGLLVEVHVAGEVPLQRRGELADRLTAAIDSARREPAADREPPELTARFMFGAVEAAAIRALALGETAGFPAQVPELAHMIVAAYYGEAVAGEELSPWECSRGRRGRTSGSRR